MKPRALVIFMLLAGCASEIDAIAASEGPVLVEVLVPSGLGEDGRTEFALEPRELERLDDVRELSGQWLRMRRGGTVVIRSEGDAIAEWSVEDDGAAAPRFAVVDGVLVARDYPTLVMSTAYYHLDQTFAQLEDATGLSADELTGELGRVDVLFEPRIRAERDGREVTLATEANAAFLSPQNGLRALFMLQQRSDMEAVPLSMDPRVLAHETGHAVFDTLLGDRATCEQTPLEERQRDRLFAGRLDLQDSVRGLNEGFADLLAFAITGTTNPLEAWGVAERDLAATNDVPLPSSFYGVGSALSRAVFRSYRDLGRDPSDPQERHAMMRVLAATIAGLREQLAAQPIAPANELELACAHGVDTLALPVFRAFLAAVPDAELAERLRFHFPQTLAQAGYQVSP